MCIADLTRFELCNRYWIMMCILKFIVEIDVNHHVTICWHFQVAESVMRSCRNLRPQFCSRIYMYTMWWWLINILSSYLMNIDFSILYLPVFQKLRYCSSLTLLKTQRCFYHIPGPGYYIIVTIFISSLIIILSIGLDLIKIHFLFSLADIQLSVWYTCTFLARCEQKHMVKLHHRIIYFES